MKEHGKKVRLVHNPAAGDEDNGDKDELCQLIEELGHHCTVVAKKDAVKKIDPETDIIALAGGDGTIKMTIMALLEKKLRFKRPIAILPQGTANNIAISLGIPLDCKQAMNLWSHFQLKKFDVGMVTGLGRKPLHFIESIGFGVFPILMEKMDKKNTNAANAEDEIRIALEQLRKLALTFPAKVLKLVTATGSIEKECIMVEVMNISSMGPRLVLAVDADPGDGQFDIIVVTADQRQELVAYIDGLLKKKDVIFNIKPIRASRLTMEWQGTEFHIDDECKGYTGQRLKISLLDSLIEIIVEGN
ncbi:diacylglycerol/lipid kinase family protein [Sphingobacterium detergens]|uniref:Diacylglycerol kinase family enzyme n=1 Tax=Sphingobacterium detergens TaxID=1145106 RepID=A0A420BKG0_SPHD1|nr:diacylglycerol kinase family protein [Sphingobacterium detergens]RKE57202.1 diacylglycerol kinase family enzyme [Sphingobacterium detergens]